MNQTYVGELSRASTDHQTDQPRWRLGGKTGGEAGETGSRAERPGSEAEAGSDTVAPARNNTSDGEHNTRRRR